MSLIPRHSVKEMSGTLSAVSPCRTRKDLAKEPGLCHSHVGVISFEHPVQDGGRFHGGRRYIQVDWSVKDVLMGWPTMQQSLANNPW